VPCCCAATSFLPPIAVNNAYDINPTGITRTFPVLNNDIDPLSSDASPTLTGIILLDSSGNEVTSLNLKADNDASLNFGDVTVVVVSACSDRRTLAHNLQRLH
jgi:hypothetical protein